ncbi:MAG: hypothetical protein KKE35_03405, partial [Actinobacteria bacterium]|nr:hypothetical protein [Actinomycetota bacterium]
KEIIKNPVPVIAYVTILPRILLGKESILVFTDHLINFLMSFLIILDKNCIFIFVSITSPPKVHKLIRNSL